MLLECAYFVYRCNTGDWPEWIRMGVSAAGIQGRGAVVMGTAPNTIGGAGSTNASGSCVGNSFGSHLRGASKKTVLLQREAGRCFYAWAIQVQYINKQTIKQFIKI